MISEKLKKRIIDLFSNTKLEVYSIFELINEENGGNFNIDEYYEFLNEYTEQEGNVLEKNKDVINSKVDDIIYNLTIKGASINKIRQELIKANLETRPSIIEKRRKEIFEKKGEKIPVIREKNTKKVPQKEDKKITRKLTKKVESTEKAKEPRINKKDLVDENEVFELRKRGLSARKIAKYYKTKGLELSQETIRKIYKKMYSENNEEEYRYEKLGNRYANVATEVINMRKKGYSYKVIVDKLSEEGIQINVEKASKMFNKSNPDTKIKTISEVKRRISDDDIYRLRQQGLSLRETTDYFNNQGIKVSFSYISYNSKRIFDEKGEKCSKSRNRDVKALDNYTDEIYSLKKQGKSIPYIRNYLVKCGLSIGDSTVYKKCKEIFSKKGEDVPDTINNNRKYIFNKLICNNENEPDYEQQNKVKYEQDNRVNYKQNDKDKITNKSLLDAVLKLKEKKNATDEQMKKFVSEVSKMYKINIEPEYFRIIQNDEKEEIQI